MRLAHGSLAQLGHDVPLHLVNVLLQVQVLLSVLGLAPTVKPQPRHDDDGGDGDGDDEVDPYVDRYGGGVYRRCQFLPLSLGSC